MGKAALGIGIVGAGTVGGGVIRILTEKKEQLAERAGMPLNLLRVADIDTGRLRMLGMPNSRITSSFKDIIDDENIDVVLELVGGTTIAYDITQAALQAGKGVITANKALLAERGKPLFQLAGEKGVPLLFEAAVCGAIPVIQAIRDGLVANEISCILGIVNGTCNYILTQMQQHGQDYNTALAEAQRLGYAEADPTFDVGGVDSAHKLSLLAALAFDTFPEWGSIPTEGITKLNSEDMQMASEMGYVIKLLATARKQDGNLFLSVHPALLPMEHPLANVNGSMNAISLLNDFALESMLYGRGAGDLPTASAVVSDVVSIARALACGGQPLLWQPKSSNLLTLAKAEDYSSSYFLRFTVQDRHGVLGQITTILGKHKVSVKQMIQHGEQRDIVPIIITTHLAREGDLREALKEIEALDCVEKPTGVLRVEA